ncbi:MAG: amino acid permease [Alicyclobacillaceae bacterium]|nr:amino acid permease [Alicyclobacillaceae bacterium]
MGQIKSDVDSTKYPHAGGIVEYARLALGETAGRITAWLFLGTIPIGVPIIALVGANYVAGTFGLPSWTIPVMAALMLLVSLTLHWRGLEMAAWIQVLILMLIAVLMVTAIVTAGPHMRVTHFEPLMPHGWLPIGTSAVEIFWCFVGWEMVGHLAEEFRDPARDLRKVFILAPALVGVLYVALSIVTVGTHAYGVTDTVAPLSQLVGIGLGQTGSTVTGGVALLITLVAIHGNVAGFSRMVYSQARAGVFPALLGRLHQRHHTPVGAIGVLGVDFALVLTVYTVFHVDLGGLITWPSTVFLALYGIAMVSALRLMKGERWTRWLVPLVPLVVCIGLYPLSGWAMLYPLVLALVGWLIHQRSSNP